MLNTTKSLGRKQTTTHELRFFDLSLVCATNMRTGKFRRFIPKCFLARSKTPFIADAKKGQ